MKKFWKETPPPCILGKGFMLGIVFAIVSASIATADVGDNTGLACIAEFLGIGSATSTPATYGGSIVERLNYLEKNCATKDDLADVIKNGGAVKSIQRGVARYSDRVIPLAHRVDPSKCAVFLGNWGSYESLSETELRVSNNSSGDIYWQVIEFY